MTARTLANMTRAEQAECFGMWADIAGQEGIIRDVWDSVDGVRVRLMFPAKNCFAYFAVPEEVTPRLDLPRAWTPTGGPVPGEWEERTDQGGMGDYIWFTRQRRYITDWEEQA